MNIAATMKSSKTRDSEWYTPQRYVDAAREVLGDIDLDPASSRIANETIKATRYFTVDDDGLNRSWSARGGVVRAWLNPPYGIVNGQSNQGIWTRKLIEEYKAGNVSQAVLLVTAATDMKWFPVVWEYPVCFVEHKIHFYGPQRENREHPQGACFVYFGPNESTFVSVFQRFGTIARRITPKDGT